ncbi:MAG: hypothetical protein ACOC0A_04375 [Planctomycetota bacterium]
MLTQTEKEKEARENGLRIGHEIMAGKSGATRDVPARGRHHFREASATAQYIGIPEKELLDAVSDFHRERVDSPPDTTRYPETRGEREVLLQRYEGMREAGMSRTLVALHESLTFWQKYRMPEQFGKIYNPVAVGELAERCRVVYMPESDQGPLHFKNVDDPLSSWSPRPPEEQGQSWPHSPLFFDGTGSGLHIDEKAEEIFPLDVQGLCREHCTTVEEVTEFMVRYNHFWDSSNLLVHDEEGNSVAFDKASRGRIAVREPDSSGINYVNGMSSFDPEYQSFIDQQRQMYLDETGQDENSVEGRYFAACDQVLHSMKQCMGELKQDPTLSRLVDIMCRRDGKGPLCKSGERVHPDQPNRQATLMQRLHFLNSHIMFRRQWRGDTPVWEDSWEQVCYR